jgi:hypothetical protein
MFMGAEVRLRSTPTKSEDYAILEVEDFDESVYVLSFTFAFPKPYEDHQGI